MSECSQTVALIEYSVLTVRTGHAQPVADPSGAGEISLGSYQAAGQEKGPNIAQAPQPGRFQYSFLFLSGMSFLQGKGPQTACRCGTKEAGHALKRRKLGSLCPTDKNRPLAPASSKVVNLNHSDLSTAFLS
jgi:hypothetical protein